MYWPNDWKIRDCLLLCGALTVAQVLLTVMASAGLEVPFLHQTVGFIFLSFVPGILLLRIIKVHGLNVVESLAYSIGLSLALVIFSEVLINFVLPVFNITKPLTIYPILITLAIATVILMGCAWLRDRHYAYQGQTRWGFMANANAIIFLFIILALIILGVQISDITGSNLALIIALLAIGLAVALAAIGKFISPTVYPLAIFVIALGLLYQTTLMSPYLVGSDIFTEYQFYNVIAVNGIWDYSFPNPVNTCLSIVMLAPSYSLMMGISGFWVFKAVYPLLFSIVPIILFRVFRTQIGPKPAFLAVFLFLAVPTFSLEMISLCRQQVAEIFLALTILLFVDNRLCVLQKTVLLIILAPGAAASHYSMGFIMSALLVLSVPLLAIIRSQLFLKIWGKITTRTGGLPLIVTQREANFMPLHILIIPVAFYMLFLLAWYGWIASGANLHFISSLFSFQINVIGSEVASSLNQPSSSPMFQIGARPDLIRTALGLDFLEVTWQGKLFRIFQYITQFLIIAGCFRLLFSPRGMNFKPTYISLCVISVGFLAACMLFPGFAGILNATRWYHISLLTLAPLAILGAEAIWNLFAGMVRKARHKFKIMKTVVANQKYLVHLALLVLIPYYIFTSGLVFELTGQKEISKIDTPYSIALSSYRIDITGIFNRQDYDAAAWISSRLDKQTTVYADAHAVKIFALRAITGMIAYITRENSLTFPGNIYLTSWNSGKGELAFTSMGKPGLREHIPSADLPGFTDTLKGSNIIYTNGGAELFSLKQ